MKTYASLILILLATFGSHLSIVAAIGDYQLRSPNGKISVELQATGQSTTFALSLDGHRLLLPSPIGLQLSDGTTVGHGKVVATKKNRHRGTVDVLVGKNSTLADNYNELIISYEEGYDLQARVYDEGWAYRWVTRMADSITIKHEELTFNFAFKPRLWFPECDPNTYNEREQNGQEHPIDQGYRNFERLYRNYDSPADIPAGRWAVSPVLAEEVGTDYKVVVAESNVYDYPGLYIESGGECALNGKWAAYPKQVMDGDPNNPSRFYSNHLVISRENYIARTEGSRAFPWRVVIPTSADRELLNNELVYLLADPCEIADPSWVKPGKSAWEWWHKAVLEGVDFPNGNRNLTLQLYQYYVDWASRNGIEYLTLDAGWKDSYIAELCRYAHERDVKILVWTWASCPLEAPEDWIEKMHRYGVDGAKIDFFERNDQVAMRWQKQLAKRLADRQMVVVFHGCPVPSGLNRTYPNVLNYEAVRGAECNFWEDTMTPDHHTRFPFIRSLVGPEDYTPGSMRQVTRSEFKPRDVDNVAPMSLGTRAHELSMYVILDQWIGYLADSPTEYDKFPDITGLLSRVPTTWKRTVPLDGRLGEYILMAKENGGRWYVGGMTNWQARSLTVDFSFLPKSKHFKATIFRDAPSSAEHPTDYVRQTMTIDRSTRLPIEMAEGGGFIIELEEL